MPRRWHKARSAAGGSRGNHRAPSDDDQLELHLALAAACRLPGMTGASALHIHLVYDWEDELTYCGRKTDGLAVSDDPLVIACPECFELWASHKRWYYYRPRPRPGHAPEVGPAGRTGCGRLPRQRRGCP